jgi:hypothetical protein
VLGEVKNTMAIEFIPIMLSPDGIDMELAVDVVMSVPDIVLVGDVDMEMVVLISFMAMMLIVQVILQPVNSRRCYARSKASLQERLRHKREEKWSRR